MDLIGIALLLFVAVVALLVTVLDALGQLLVAAVVAIVRAPWRGYEREPGVPSATVLWRRNGVYRCFVTRDRRVASVRRRLDGKGHLEPRRGVGAEGGAQLGGKIAAEVHQGPQVAG